MASPFIVDQTTLTEGLREAADFRAALDKRRTEAQLRRDMRAGVNTDIGAGYQPYKGVPQFEDITQTPQQPAPQPRAGLQSGDASGVPEEPVAPPPTVEPDTYKPALLADQNVLRALMMAESGGNPLAVSSKGALGRFQVMPETLDNPGFGITPAKDRTAAEVDRVGREYFTAMLRRYEGDIDRAVVAYNWGFKNADSWDGQWESLPGETQRLVARVRAQIGPDQLAFEPQEVSVAPGVKFDTAEPATQEPTAQEPTAPVAQAGVQTEDVTIRNRGRKRQVSGVATPENQTPEGKAAAQQATTPPTKRPRIPVGLQNKQMTEYMNQRQQLLEMADLYRRSRNPAFYEIRSKIMNLDAGIASVVNDRALNVFDNRNDPGLLNEVLSRRYGSPTEVRPTGSGDYVVFQNGQAISEAMSKGKLIHGLRRDADNDYDASLRQATAASAQAALETQQKAIADIAVENVKGRWRVVEKDREKAGIVRGADGDYLRYLDGRVHRIIGYEEREVSDTGKKVTVPVLAPLTGAGGGATKADYLR